MGVRNSIVYGILGIGGLWLAFLLSGIHATIAGVLAALAIPVKTKINPEQFSQKLEESASPFRNLPDAQAGAHHSDQYAIIHQVNTACEQIQTPLYRLEHALYPWVTYRVMPIFALANAGVHFEGPFLSNLKEAIPLGVILGLFVGKPFGIFLFTWLAVRLKGGALPTGIRCKQILGVGFLWRHWVYHVSFHHRTCFQGGSFLTEVKVGILIGSTLSGLGGENRE